jgi:hypothetical protein
MRMGMGASPLLQGVPWESLQRFYDDSADARDWLAVTVRIRLNLELAKRNYEEASVKEMAQCLTASVTVHERFEQTGHWIADAEECAMLEAALKASAVIEEENTPEEVADAHAHVLRELNFR